MIPPALLHPRSALLNLGLRFAQRLLYFAAWLYCATSTEDVRVVVTIQELHDAPEDDDDEPECPTYSRDPAFIQWLDDIYDESPNE